MKKPHNSDRKVGASSAFRVGAVCLAFMILGYQASLFVHRAAVLKIISASAAENSPSTPIPYSQNPNSGTDTLVEPIRYTQEPKIGTESFVGPNRYSQEAKTGTGERQKEIKENVVKKYVPRKVESFRFNPNTVTAEELQRLGFSEKQAASICNYREKGGQFRRKSDFAKSYVVADSVYRRLEPFIDIPLLDINKADSAAFDALPGIGGYFAAKMVSYRAELGGYSCPEQLLEIWHFDEEKFAGIADLISCNPTDARPFGLWTLPADSLRMHPAIRSWQTARSIVLFRNNTPADSLTVPALVHAGILTEEQGVKLARCRLASKLK